MRQYFYKVLVGTAQFHGQEPLTYSSEQLFQPGTIVQVPLRQTTVVGVVVSPDQRPSFKVKPIARQITDRPLPHQLLSLITWLQIYYPAPLGSLVQLVVPSSLVRKRSLPPVTGAHARPADTVLPTLTPEQQQAVAVINQTAAQTVLVHGDTGTGKTRLYIELGCQTLASGRSVLVLTPEIGLTPQLLERLANGLSAPVISLHSNLNLTDRRTAWLQILQARQPVVVVGPRSALFAPIADLGLIVIDEAHDQAYKQEQMPHYQATRVAGKLAQLHQAKLILGSATPLITDYYYAKVKHLPVIRLTQRPAGAAQQRHIELVNLRDQRQFGQRPHLSNSLLKHIHQALDNHQQALVFLNRRGTARLIMCQLCGWTAQCPHCDLPLTYHGDQHLIRCHTCGYQHPAPTSCSACHSPDIIFKAIGTKSIVSELAKEFPRAIIKRFDTDTLQAERLEHHYQAILKGEVDILVGTQMLTKGLDLPRLTVAGVIVADTSLYFPDYTAEEHTYQLLTQIIGRVGRGHTDGRVVIQSYAPSSPAIQAAIEQNWDKFYNKQLAERQQYGFPPFFHYLKLSCARQSNQAAHSSATKLMTKLQQIVTHVDLIGPSPSFYERQAGQYRWQIIAKAKNRRELTKIIPLLPANWHYDLDPSSLL